MIEREVELLAWSKTLMPALPVDSLHGLVVEEMGKNFSGTGVDTNIIGRLRITGEDRTSNPKSVTFPWTSRRNPGNATGIGSGFHSQKLVDKVDRKATYLNNLTTTFVTGPFCPWYDTEQEALETMMFCLRSISGGSVAPGAGAPSTSQNSLHRGRTAQTYGYRTFSLVHRPRPVPLTPREELAGQNPTRIDAHPLTYAI